MCLPRGFALIPQHPEVQTKVVSASFCAALASRCCLGHSTVTRGRTGQSGLRDRWHFCKLLCSLCQNHPRLPQDAGLFPGTAVAAQEQCHRSCAPLLSVRGQLGPWRGLRCLGSAVLHLSRQGCSRAQGISVPRAVQGLCCHQGWHHWWHCHRRSGKDRLCLLPHSVALLGHRACRCHPVSLADPSCPHSRAVACLAAPGPSAGAGAP